jgi:hypothetical protein
MESGEWWALDVSIRGGYDDVFEDVKIPRILVYSTNGGRGDTSVLVEDWWVEGDVHLLVPYDVSADAEQITRGHTIRKDATCHDTPLHRTARHGTARYETTQHSTTWRANPGRSDGKATVPLT